MKNRPGINEVIIVLIIGMVVREFAIGQSAFHMEKWGIIIFTLLVTGLIARYIDDTIKLVKAGNKEEAMKKSRIVKGILYFALAGAAIYNIFGLMLQSL